MMIGEIIISLIVGSFIMIALKNTRIENGKIILKS